jgi:putative transposase
MDSVAVGPTVRNVRKSFKYKLCPTPEQERTCAHILARGRELYHAGLQERRDAWRKCHVTVTRWQQEAQLKAIRAEIPEYGAIHSHVLQDVLARLDRAFQAFFRRLQAGETPGYPRFHGRDRYTSFTYKQFGNGARLDNGFLVLAKIGRVAVRWSRPLEGAPKTVTISEEADGWYACFSCADVPTQPLPLTGEETGIDLGVESFATLADGTQIANPRIFRVWEMRLKRAQRRVARRQKRSHRRRQAVRLLARAHQQVQRVRADFHHKTALALVRRYDIIYHEDLQAANVVRRPAPKPKPAGPDGQPGQGGYERNGASQKSGLNKSILDAGWGQFCRILAFKAAYAGKRVVAVPPAFTSQACSSCGVLVQKALSVRWHSCPECGAALHRDHNAALNVLRRGHEQRRDSGAGQAPQASTQPVGAYVA